MGVRRFGFLVIVQLLLVACSAGGQAPAAAKEKAASILIRDVKDHSPSRGLTEAAYAQRIIELKNKIEGKGFHIVLERPFVVVGDESPQLVEKRAVGTVRWAVERLKRDFFPSDPKEVLDIWLFKDDESYREHALEFFHDEPSSPYGYFLASGHALIMNIGTGGGTLVHEIVHPFMETNFPACPPWFNEGLASLYEQSGDKGGHIVGYTNWRLPGLQEVIREGDLLSFQSLFALTAEQFYGARSGRNYAQARYLCYYLQEKGLLVDYFKKFSASVYEDYTGYKTLQEVLGEKDVAAFQKRWEAWVLTLRR